MTNKKFKKAVSLMMATGMAMSCFATTNAFAATEKDNVFSGNTSLQVSTEKTNRAYELYQIFAGNYHRTSEGAEILTDVTWGKSTSPYSDKILTALTADKLSDGTANPLKTLFKTTDTADTVAETVKEFGTDTDKLDVFAAIVADVLAQQDQVEKISENKYNDMTGEDTYNYLFDNIATGYYLVKEVPNSDNDEKDRTYSKYMVNVVGGDGTEIDTKETDAPTITKGILTGDEDVPETKTVDESVTTKKDEAVGDTVEYRLDSKVPDMNGYSKYFYIVNDTLAKGLDLNEKSFVITVGDTTLTQIDKDKATADNTDPTFYTEVTKDTTTGKTSLKIVLCNFIQYTAGQKITIRYDAVVNENIQYGSSNANLNAVDLTYSNNPNYDYKGVNEPDGDDDKAETNTTPESKTYVYSAAIEIIKQDDNENRLKGAEFKITDAGTDTNLNTVVKVTQKHTPVGYASQYADDSDAVVYYKKNDGSFTTGKPQANTTIYAKECVHYTQDGKIDITGGYYKLADKDEYVAISDADTDTSKYVTDYVAYTRTETQELVKKGTGDYVGTVGENGALILEGLAAGTYKIEETKAPSGYNKLDDPITVTVTFNPNESYIWSYYDNTSNKYTEDNPATNASGIYELHITNKEGSKLPSTGGMGTTIFYIVGSALVLSSGVLLVTKKRMKKSDK
jgi:fimbrial isopeptide formation D2 family protein/LPXTG-motif cell wall-anchored protein